MDTVGILERLSLALAIGFLIGIERGWKQRAQSEGARTAGLRTYALSGLLGGFSGVAGLQFGGVAFAALALAFVAVFASYSWREARAENDYSVTGVVAALLVFVIAAYAQFGSMPVAAAAAVATATILAFKETLHGWLKALQWPEIRSALLILAMTFIALPVLPDRPLDPYGALNPRELWLLTILIASASFVGYVALRVFGARAGLILGAVAGALVSSTVVTLELSARVRAGGATPMLAAAAATLASVVMIARIALLAYFFAAPAFAQVWPPLLAAAVASSAVFAVLWLLSEKRQQGEPLARLENPLDIKSVVRFSLILCVLMVTARIVVYFFGSQGAMAFAATGGLVDVDAVTLAIGKLLRQGTDPATGAAAVLLAATADTLSKSAITMFSGNMRFAALYVGGSIALLAAGAAAYGLL